MACVRDTLYAEITEIFEKENFLKVSVFCERGIFGWNTIRSISGISAKKI